MPSWRRDRAPDAESPLARDDEQEVAGGRPASTPVVVLANVALLVGLLVVVALILAVLGYLLA